MMKRTKIIDQNIRLISFRREWPWFSQSFMVVVFFLSPTVSGGGGEKVEKLLRDFFVLVMALNNGLIICRIYRSVIGK
jgi:ABC-type amino acid transport system permease subunit